MAAASFWGEEKVKISVNTPNTDERVKWQFWQLTSGDFAVFGEALGEAFGDFDVDLRSDGFEV